MTPAREKATRIKGAIGLPFLVVIFSLACGGNENILRSGKETPTQSNTSIEKSTFDIDLESIRTAGFSFVYVLRRKDGGPIDAEDRGVIKLNTADAGRRLSADDGRAFLIGSKFLIPAKNMLVLYNRFAIEDHSLPAAPNANVNANK